MTLSAGISTLGNAGLLMSGVGSLFGGIGGIVSGALNNGYASHAAHDLAILQANLYKKQWKRSLLYGPNYQKLGLLKAHLNPVLAANSGATYASSSMPGGSSPSLTNLASSAREGIETALGIRSTLANLENMSANTQQVRSETRLLNEKTNTQEAMTKLTNAQNDIAQIDKQLKSVDLKYADKQRLLEQRREASYIVNLNQEYLKIDSERQLIRAQQTNANADTALKKSQEWRNYHMPLNRSKFDYSGHVGIPKLMEFNYDASRYR